MRDDPIVEIAPARYSSLKAYLKEEITTLENRVKWLKSQWEWKPPSKELSAGQRYLILANRPTQKAIDRHQEECLAAEEILAFLRDQLIRLKKEKKIIGGHETQIIHFHGKMPPDLCKIT